MNEMATEVEQHIDVETEGGIGWIRFNRPEKMNAIGALTRQQLGDAIKQAERDDAVRVVVLTGAGRAFSSGADVTEMVSGGGMRTPEDVGKAVVALVTGALPFTTGEVVNIDGGFHLRKFPG